MSTAPIITAPISTAPITIESMDAKYNRPVGRLLAQAFHGKFSRRTELGGGDLAPHFEKLLQYVPAEPFTQRMVALQEGEVIGSIAIKRKPMLNALTPTQKIPLAEIVSLFGNWRMIQMLIGLHVLDHEPEAGECYIADLAVHSDQQGKGIGRLLIQWARHVVDTDPQLDRLSLHVSSGNLRARQLYEKLSFHTSSREKRFILFVLCNQWEWEYMVQEKRGAGRSC
ncbi:GNAT family N-acetyltransferase [Paenibacillus tritici]|uniref:GNAT family N-acetyltransferase n=1 Tax=Paenibacillus tritici TaxID=1873425 RepID=UPI001BA815B0|nr:GNAT family N-acetyltransferase [Paenibacillus tritici]QUL54902.1 GNAT family N-acetyltransferase [Paenibacillus tritici]